MPHLGTEDPGDMIHLSLGYTVDNVISQSNVLEIKLKRLPKISAIEPLYTPTLTFDNLITIHGTNFE